jgi:hypothetical protein
VLLSTELIDQLVNAIASLGEDLIPGYSQAMGIAGFVGTASDAVSGLAGKIAGTLEEFQSPNSITDGGFANAVGHLLGFKANTTRILKGTANGASFRVPDILEKFNFASNIKGKLYQGILGEVKSRKYIGNTRQIQDYIKYSNSNGLRFQIFYDTRKVLGLTTRHFSPEILRLQRQGLIDLVGF